MKLSIKALALACGIIWAVVMLLVGLARMASPAYGLEFMQVMASIYPGFDTAATIKNAIVGALYGLVDAGIGGAIFAFVYNRFA